MRGVLLDAVVLCPRCGHTKRESMTNDACLYFYECEG